MDLANPLPRIFLQVANADLELDGAHQIDRDESRAIESIENRQHVLGAHARCPQALMGVAKRRVDDADTTFRALRVHRAAASPSLDPPDALNRSCPPQTS